MQARLYRTKTGYDFINSNGILFHIEGKVQKVGRVGERFQASGKLLKKIPDHLKNIVFQLQQC